MVRIRWTIDMIKEIAQKYSTLKEFRENEHSAYKASENRKILNEVTSHMKKGAVPFTDEQKIDSRKRYYKLNKVKNSRLKSKKRSENIDEARKKDREYRKKNRDRINLRERITRQSKKCKETKLLHNRKRRALKISTADGSITKESLNDLLQKQDNKCYHCNKIMNEQKHLDHFIPLSRGGTHTIGNVVFAHPWCNMSKGSKIPKTLLLI